MKLQNPFYISDIYYKIYNSTTHLCLTPLPYTMTAACVCWSKSMTTKGLRHFQIRENAIRESVISKIIEIKHIEGKINLADLFTKEDKNAQHFLQIRNLLVQPVDFTHNITDSSSSGLRGVSNPNPVQLGFIQSPSHRITS